MLYNYITVTLNFCNTLKIRIILFICGTKVLRYNKYYSYIHITIRYIMQTTYHTRTRRETLVRAISRLVFSFTVTAG